jgi:hypothetical protein
MAAMTRDTTEALAKPQRASLLQHVDYSSKASLVLRVHETGFKHLVLVVGPLGLG